MASLPSPGSDPVGSCYRLSLVCAGFFWPGLLAGSRRFAFSGRTVRGCRPGKVKPPVWLGVDSLLGTVAGVQGREGGMVGGTWGLGRWSSSYRDRFDLAASSCRGLQL